MRMYWAGLLIAACVGTAGCSSTGVDGAGEDVGSVQQRFGADQCATRSATQTFTSRWAYTSTTSYGTGCNNLDVTSLNSANDRNTVTFTDTLPTNSTDCANTFMEAVLYDNSGGNWIVDTDVESDGAWSGSSCSVPQINFGRLAPLLPYRIAATARTYSGSSFSARQFSVNTSLIH